MGWAAMGSFLYVDLLFWGRGQSFFLTKISSCFLFFTFICSLISQLHFHIYCSWYLILLGMVENILPLEELWIKKEKKVFWEMKNYVTLWIFNYWVTFLETMKRGVLTECRFIVLKIRILCFWRYFQLLKSSALPDVLFWL